MQRAIQNKATSSPRRTSTLQRREEQEEQSEATQFDTCHSEPARLAQMIGQPPSAPIPPSSQQAIHDIAQMFAQPHPIDGLWDSFRPDQRLPYASESEVAPVQRANEASSHANHTGLPNALKTGIENLSGLAMDDVRVHYNSSQPKQLQALAYAQGSHIYVAPGQERHLPHEAWHVVQQKQGRVKSTRQKKGVAINNDPGLEREATEMGSKAIQFKNDANPASVPQSFSAESRYAPKQLMESEPESDTDTKSKYKYLVYIQESDHIKICDTKPENCVEQSVAEFHYPKVSVWYDKTVNPNKVKYACELAHARAKLNSYGRDIKFIADESKKLADPNKKTVYVSLGASPKLIKWALKSEGQETCAINVSEVKNHFEMTDAFRAYLKRKLEKHVEENKEIILMDFVDTGDSLVKIKKNIKAIFPNADVKALAIGPSNDVYRKAGNLNHEEIKFEIEKSRIPVLAEALHQQLIKQAMGRNKPKKPYKEWAEGFKEAEFNKEEQEKFKHYKQDFPESFKNFEINCLSAEDMEALLNGEEGPQQEQEDSEYTGYGEDDFF